MRINLENKSLDIESRDWNYIMSAYIRSYTFHSKNQRPEKIVFPMFQSAEGVPVEWLPEISPVVTEIKQDGSNVPEVTPEQEAAKDQVEDTLIEIKGTPFSVNTTDSIPGQKDRAPKLPTNPIPPGAPLDNMHPRDGKQDLKVTKSDLRPEKEVEEDKEVEVTALGMGKKMWKKSA